MPLGLRIHGEALAGFLERGRPVVDGRRVPVRVLGQLLVERLHQAGLAKTAVGNDDRKAW